MGGHDITTWSILQQYFSSPLPILLYVMGWHELLQGYNVTNGYSMLQSPLQRLAQINSKCEMPEAPSLRARGLEGRPREGGGAGGTPWDALGGPGVLNLSARQSQMLPDPDPEARRVACAVLSFVTSGDIR